MRGVRISSLELDSSGSIAVEKLADIFEDGEVIGDSYLASSLRKSVAERGPTPLDTIVRRFNNGYFGASWTYKGRVYIKEGDEAPAGARVQEGPRGGKYYETRAGRGRPLGEASKDWTPKEGERIRMRIPGDLRNGRLGRITSLTEENKGYRGGKLWATVEGIGWKGGGYLSVTDGQLVPAPYTAKEKREMKAKDIMVQEFGTTDHISMDRDGVAGNLDYDIYTTEAGPNLWVKREKEDDPEWMAQKDSALSMGSFLRALPHMPAQALAHMKKHVARIVFSPVSNPNDRATSARIGRIFVSAASMDMKIRTMRIWPVTKEADAERLARTLIHETGHAVDEARSELGYKYRSKLLAFWADMDEQGVDRPADRQGHRDVEREHGVPHSLSEWNDAHGKWKNVKFGIDLPNVLRYWPSLKEEGTWNELGAEKQKVLTDSVSSAAPVSRYAHTSDYEYYAEAYTFYQQGTLPEGHIMQEHFENLEKIKQWVAGWEAPKEEGVPWAAD